MDNIIDFTNGTGYKVSRFPDGETHIELDELNRKYPVILKMRLRNAEELFLLMQLADILKRQAVEISEFHIYYLMSGRCDRLFDLNRPFTLEIVANVINSLQAQKVILYEPHSDRSLNLINNSRAIYPTKQITQMVLAQSQTSADPIMYTVAPDAGADARYNCNIICGKTRNAEGKLIGFQIEKTITTYPNSNYIVLDDLCDGGGTFLGIADLLKKKFNPNSLTLVLTHAIQKEGLEKVAAVYDNVYITDSYKDWKAINLPKNIKVLNIQDFV